MKTTQSKKYLRVKVLEMGCKQKQHKLSDNIRKEFTLNLELHSEKTNVGETNGVLYLAQLVPGRKIAPPLQDGMSDHLPSSRQTISIFPSST